MPQFSRRHVCVIALVAALHGHGMGRHSAEQIHAIGCRDLTAVADFLADKPFMMGAEPTTLDASADAFLANLLWAPVDSLLRRRAASRPALEAYCRRTKARYYA